MAKSEVKSKHAVNEEGYRKITLSKDQTISMFKAKEKELQGIYGRLQELENVQMEIVKAEMTLKEMQKDKVKETLLVNIGAGVLVECEVLNNKNAKITLPGNVMVDKTIAEIMSDIEKRKKELDDVKQKLTQSYSNTMQTYQAVSKALQAMVAQSRIGKSMPEGATAQ